MIGLKFREQVGQVAQIIVDELDQLVSGLRGYLFVQHDQDGGHTHVTAESVVVSGDATVDGDLDVGGDGTFDGDVTARASVESGESGPAFLGDLSSRMPAQFSGAGVDFGGGTEASGTTAWGVGLAAALGAGTLLVADRSARGGGDEGRAFAFQRLTAQPSEGGGLPIEYALGPPSAVSAASIVTDLGRSSRPWRNIYGTDVFASSQFFEKGRATALGEWTTWTPTWAGSVSNPSLGDGTLSARYMIVGKTLFYKITLVVGSTTTFGSGNWSFSVPTDGVTTYNFTSIPVVGDALANDNNTGNVYIGKAWVVGSALGVRISTAGNPVGLLGPTVPFTWAQNDILSFGGWYEIA